MSTNYASAKEILACDLFDGRLEAFGVREEHDQGQTSENHRLLTDGNNYLHVFIGDNGFINYVTRYGGNAPGNILAAIAEAFDTDFVSEYEPQYWGFETQGDWDAFLNEMAKRDDEEFYADVVKHVGGEPNGLTPGTIGMIQAEVAKTVVAADPALLEPANKDNLLNAIREIYDRDHTVTITLTPEEIAAVALSVTHENDLPRA